MTELAALPLLEIHQAAAPWTQISRTCSVRLGDPGFGALGHQAWYKTYICYPAATRPICLIFWARVLVPSLLSTPCTLDALHRSFKRAETSALPSTSLWEHGQHHTETAARTHCSARHHADTGGKEEGKKSNIHLSASLFPRYSIYLRLTPVFSVTFRLQPVSC